MRCPYNPDHIMPEASFVNHLRKCKATNKHEFAQCKYNTRHIIRKSILEKHYQCTYIFNLEKHNQKPKQKFAEEDEDSWFSDTEKNITILHDKFDKKDDTKLKKGWLDDDSDKEKSASKYSNK